jgi:predicted dehydrogenase
MKKIGLIGLGKQMQLELIPAVLSCEDVCVVTAICDVDNERLQQTSKLFTDAKIYNDYHTLIDESRVDAIIVCVPHYLHFPIVSYANSHGISSFKEKPFALNLSEAKQLKTLHEKTKVPVFTVTKRRYFQSYITGKKYLKELGSLYRYTARHFMSSGSLQKGWRSTTKEAGGGILFDLGYHMVDTIRDYFGVPNKLWMLKSNKGLPGFRYEVEDSASLLLGYPHEIHGSFQVGCYMGVKEESLEIVGSLGYMKIEKDRIHLQIKNGEIAMFTFPTDDIAANAEALRAFFHDGTKFIQTNISDHYDNMRILDAAYHSDRTGVWSQL